MQTKNAAPAEGVKTLVNVLDNCRPHAVVGERSSENLSDTNGRAINALKSEKTLLAQTLLKDVLKFNEVQVHNNLCKTEIIDILKSLQV